LVIDEPPVQPPVLKKEGKAANVSTGKKVATKKELKVGLPPTPEVAPVDVRFYEIGIHSCCSGTSK